MRSGYLVLLYSLALALAACGPPPQQAPEAGTTPSIPGESPLPEPGTSPLPTLLAPSAAAAAAAAVTYLSAELGISQDEVTILSSEPVNWPDTSLGCPQPGMMYAQMITPGYRFLVEAKGNEYEIHTDQTGRSVVVCETE